MGFFTSRQNTLYKLIFLVLVYFVCNFLLFKYRQTQMSKKIGRDSSRATFAVGEPNSLNASGSERRRIKTILYWNPFFKAGDYRFGVGREPFVEKGCQVSACRTTNDRDELSKAAAVIFHGPRIDDFPPPSRPSGQIYVYVQEKPNYNPSISFMSAFNGHMNLTMTNRRDSDIEFPHARVIIDPAKDRVKRRRVDPTERPRSIVWVVHRCVTPSRREWYVRELKKYIDIDVFGGCGDKRCPEAEGEEDQECLAFFQEKYLFYLAPEYDVCRDYVSEKIYKAFKKQIVPIVFGGANYSYVAPPKSVIDIKLFPNPRDLAAYLKYLSNDQDAYNEYLEWKNTEYDVVVGREDILSENFCRLCSILHDPTYDYRDYTDLKGWWLDGICDASVIPKMRRMADW